MGPIIRSETFENNYHSTPRNIPESEDARTIVCGFCVKQTSVIKNHNCLAFVLWNLWLQMIIDSENAYIDIIERIFILL